MLRLDSTVRKLQLVLGGPVTTTQPDIVCSYSDATSSNYVGGAQASVGNSTTAVDIVSAPSASTVRDIDYVNVYNRDTAAIVVTIRYNDNATTYRIIVFTLQTLEQLNYTHANGWEALDAAGDVRSSISGVITGTSITNTALTSGRVVYSTTGGLETDSANLTFNGTTLTANTIGAFTLSGTIAGGGNQLNNIIIGTSTPLAGSFTALTASGALTLGVTGSATGVLTQLATNNGFISNTVQNDSTGTGAVTRWQIGNNTSPGAGQILVYGGNHSTKPNVMEINNANNLLLSLQPGAGATAVGGTLAVTSTISTGATSSTGTAVIIDGSNILRPLTSSERFKEVTQRGWMLTVDETRAFLSVKPIVYDYKKELGFDGKSRRGGYSVLGFSAEDFHNVGAKAVLNYDALGLPYSLREQAVLAHHHAILATHETRLAALEPH